LIAVDQNGRLIGQVRRRRSGLDPGERSATILSEQREILTMGRNGSYSPPNWQGTPVLNYDSAANNLHLAWPVGTGRGRSRLQGDDAHARVAGGGELVAFFRRAGPSVTAQFVFPFNAVREGEVITQQIPPTATRDAVVIGRRCRSRWRSG
jgi:hypothetical protein